MNQKTRMPLSEKMDEARSIMAMHGHPFEPGPLLTMADNLSARRRQVRLARRSSDTEDMIASSKKEEMAILSAIRETRQAARTLELASEIFEGQR